jgi:hypothetical protein
MYGKDRVFGLILLSSALALAACGSDDGGGDGDDDNGGQSDGGGGGGGGTDADAGDDTGGITPPPRESIYVVWGEQPSNGASDPSARSRLLVGNDDCSVDSAEVCGGAGSCDSVEIAPQAEGSEYCRYRCELTPSMDYLVYGDSSDPQTVRYVRLGDDFQPTGADEVLATGVSSYVVADGAVAYRTTDTVFMADLVTGTSTQIEQLAGLGGMYTPPSASTVIVKRVTSVTGTTMDLVRYNPDGGGETLLYTFQDAQETGSLLSGNEAVAMSPNEQFVAVLTNYRNQTNICATNADCTEAGFTCPIGGVNARCNSQQLTIQVINLESAGQLGVSCTGDADCGERHTCDLAAPSDSGEGTCIPGRIPLGYSGQNRCTVLRVGEYDGAVGDMQWINDRQVTGVFSNSCSGADIPITDVVTVDTQNGTIQALIENVGEPFGGCVDQVEQCYDANECTVQYYDGAVSPAGAWYGLVGDSYSAKGNPELWLYDVRGDERIPVTRSIFTDVISVQVFAR